MMLILFRPYSMSTQCADRENDYFGKLLVSDLCGKILFINTSQNYKNKGALGTCGLNVLLLPTYQDR